MILRTEYLKRIRPFYDSDLIKIITGIRRCGKSVVLTQIMDEIGKISDNIIYLNFEDTILTSEIRNGEMLVEYVESHRKKSKVYLFFDEIQLLENWNIACRTLRLHNASVFITGSNSKLLSREFAAELSGRYVSFVIRPFVYKEILEYCKQLNKEASISDYLIWGGFPKRFEFGTQTEQIAYLKELNNTIVINDLIGRYNIKKEALFINLVNFILKSNSRIFSTKSVHDYISEQCDKCSVNTIMNYMDYLEQAYITDSISQYSSKAKHELAFYKKIYNTDVSFNSLRCTDGRFDITHNFENIVYNELLYRGYQLQVFNDGKNEIDFIARKNNMQYFIQVAYSIAEEKTYKREFAAFNRLDNSVKKIIITNDDIDYTTSTVTHLNFKNFLMADNL